MKLKKILLLLFVSLFTISSVNSVTLELIETDPAPIVAGDYADITLRFTNNNIDQILEGAQFEIIETEYIKPFDASVSFEKVFTGETITRTFRVFFSDEIPQGYIDLPIEGSYNNNINIESDIRVFIKGSDSNPIVEIGQVESIPDEILQDTKDNKLSVTLQNLGDKSAELVLAELIVDESLIKPSTGFSFTDSVASINSGEERVIEFEVDVEEGVMEGVDAKIFLRYRAEKSVGNGYDIFNKTLNFEIPISESPVLKIEKVEQFDSFKVATIDNRFRITIVNEGLEDASDVRVRLAPDISYPFIFERTTNYVSSEVKAGERAQIDFKVEVLDNAQARDYPITVELESLVEETRYSSDDTMILNVKPGEKRSNFEIGAYIIGIVIFISLIIGYLRIRAYNKNKKSKK